LSKEHQFSTFDRLRHVEYRFLTMNMLSVNTFRMRIGLRIDQLKPQFDRLDKSNNSSYYFLTY